MRGQPLSNLFFVALAQTQGGCCCGHGLRLIETPLSVQLFVGHYTNDIEVEPAGVFTRTDADIAQAVRHVLQWDALVPDERIQSTVSDGWVTLEGEVDLWRERQDAERAILRLEGVVGVLNKLTIASRKVDAEQLRKEIECALERRADREAERLRIEVHNGAIDLFGRVHSWQEKRAVVGSISHAPGVAEIRDRLRIDPYF